MGWFSDLAPDCSFARFTPHSELYDKADVYVRELSTDFSLNLPESKIRSNAKSLSKFCWTHRDQFIANRAAFIEIQRQRAYRSHKARKRNNTIKIRRATRKLRKEGQTITKTAIAEVSGISVQSLAKRNLKTDLSEAFSAGAHQTAEIKRAATEAKIKQVIEKFIREGRRISKSAIAREAGLNRSTVYEYTHLFEIEKVSD